MTTRAALLPIVFLCGCAAVNPLRDAPPDAARPAPQAASGALAKTLEQASARPALPEPGKACTLAELIDLAQRNNRETRLAWHRARAAAVATGLSAAEFYPLLAVAASYGGGLWDLDLNFNNNLTGIEKQAGLVGALLAGAVPSDINLDSKTSGAYRAGSANLGLRWIVFDFGARSASLDAAKREQLAANLGFNSAHQNVARATAQAYYACEGTRLQAEAATSAAVAADEILAAAVARFDRGLLREAELAQARQVQAQAAYALTSVQAARELAIVDLCEVAGLPPGTGLRVAPSKLDPRTARVTGTLDAAVRDALRGRPDLLAKVASVQAAESRLRAARRARLPELAIEGVAAATRFDTGIQGAGPLDSFGLGLQNYGGFLTVQWPLFTGFAAENRERAAEVARDAAQEELALAREHTISEVWRAYTRAKNAASSVEAAAALESASRDHFDATRAAFENGLANLQDLLSARAALAQAHAARAESETAFQSAATELAFQRGGL